MNIPNGLTVVEVMTIHKAILLQHLSNCYCPAFCKKREKNLFLQAADNHNE
jgi:hypothetical protein